MSRIDAMDQGIEATVGQTVRTAGIGAWLTRHAFWVGVGAISATVMAFLAHQLMAWPPHEDETLALFVGRDSLPGVVEHVTRDRGGAPLHFLVAWAVAHLGFGLGALRLVSAALVVASLPLTALLGTRVASRRSALAGTALLAGSWILLFHGVYGRMYGLFLALSLLATLALLSALERPGRLRWGLWVAAALAMVATHPYGVLVLGGHGAYVLLARRDRLRGAAGAGLVVAVLGIPFWLTDLVLAERFEVGVGGGGAKLGGPGSVLSYLWRTAGDMSAGWWPVVAVALALAAIGLATEAREARALALCLVAVPTLAFVLARLGGATSPESRHLIFLAPLFAIGVGAGCVRLARGRPLVAVALVSALLVAEVAWAWERTPALFTWEPDQRQAARGEAESWLARSGRPDDVLLGYDPLFLGAWERQRDVSALVVPRADPTLALKTLERAAPLGRGVWVLDASRRNNLRPRLEIERLLPTPATPFEARSFGPFLVIRTREPTRTVERYLHLAARALLVGRRLGIGDADVNLQTVERAARTARGYGPSLRWRSSNSR